MPRVDNSDYRNLVILQRWGESYWLGIELDDLDPGSVPPMDLCIACWMNDFSEHDSGLVEHPPYDEDLYLCAICQEELIGSDDYPI